MAWRSRFDDHGEEGGSYARDFFVRLIGVLQLLGGITGCVLAVVMLTRAPEVPGYSIMVLLIPSGIVANAGWHLWRFRPLAMKTSLVIQALQIIQVTRPYFSYEFHFGVGLQLLVYPSDWDVKLKLGASALVGPPHLSIPFIFGINIVALAAFLFLLLEWRRRRKATGEKE